MENEEEIFYISNKKIWNKGIRGKGKIIELMKEDYKKMKY